MAANVGHILSLTVFAGAIAVMDLRMLGVFLGNDAGLRSSARRGLLPCVRAARDGAHRLILFSAEASHVALNPVFQFKVALIVLGLLNVAYFEFFVKSRRREFELRSSRCRAKPGSPELRHWRSGCWSRPAAAASPTSDAGDQANVVFAVNVSTLPRIMTLNATTMRSSVSSALPLSTECGR